MTSSSEKGELLHHPVSDVGGSEGGPVTVGDHVLEPWEKRCHATLECLDWRGVMSTEEKRRGVEDLGQLISEQLSYYEKWVVSATNHLLEHGYITQDQLSSKIDEVRARYRAKE
jgi:hypothetical protein